MIVLEIIWKLHILVVQAQSLASSSCLVPLGCTIPYLSLRKPLDKCLMLPKIDFVWIFCPISQGWLKKWIWQWQAKFLSQIPSLISKNDTNIISLFVKNKQFCKLRRLWLKNWACHAHLKFKFQKGVAGTIFEPHLWNFGKICIFYRSINDISTIFWYS